MYLYYTIYSRKSDFITDANSFKIISMDRCLKKYFATIKELFFYKKFACNQCIITVPKIIMQHNKIQNICIKYYPTAVETLLKISTYTYLLIVTQLLIRARQQIFSALKRAVSLFFTDIYLILSPPISLKLCTNRQHKSTHALACALATDLYFLINQQEFCKTGAQVFN